MKQEQAGSSAAELLRRIRGTIRHDCVEGDNEGCAGCSVEAWCRENEDR